MTTLVAITYNPPATGSKWRKGLALISSKLQHHSSNNNKRSSRSSSSNTTKAAATEKVLRHNSSNVMIKCEDLTAKEFAQMAGIKIKCANDEDFLEEGYLSSASSSNEDIMYLTTKTTNTTTHQQHQMTSVSTTLSTKSCHHIWDSDFWQAASNSSSSVAKEKDEDLKQLSKTNTNTSTTTTNTTNTTNINNNNDTLFISQLRSSVNTAATLNTIQKGRFKIIVGQDDANSNSEPAQHLHHHQIVLEWKRKRSDSSSTNITKKK